MKIYFKQIYHLFYSDSGNLCTWGRERRRRMGTNKFIFFKVMVSPGWGRNGMGLGGSITTFPIYIHSHLKSWVGRGGWSKSGGPWHPELMQSVCVCMCSVRMDVHVFLSMYVSTSLCASVFTGACAYVYCVHTCVHLCLWVCEHVYTWVHHINTPNLSLEKSWPSKCDCKLGLFCENFKKIHNHTDLMFLKIKLSFI